MLLRKTGSLVDRDPCMSKFHYVAFGNKQLACGVLLLLASRSCIAVSCCGAVHVLAVLTFAACSCVAERGAVSLSSLYRSAGSPASAPAACCSLLIVSVPPGLAGLLARGRARDGNHHGLSGGGGLRLSDPSAACMPPGGHSSAGAVLLTPQQHVLTLKRMLLKGSGYLLTDDQLIEEFNAVHWVDGLGAAVFEVKDRTTYISAAPPCTVCHPITLSQPLWFNYAKDVSGVLQMVEDGTSD